MDEGKTKLGNTRRFIHNCTGFVRYPTNEPPTAIGRAPASKRSKPPTALLTKGDKIVTTERIFIQASQNG